MTSPEIEARLRRMIVDRLFLSITPEEIPAEDALMDKFGIDSVNLLELVVGLEEEFGLELDGGDFNVRHFRTLTALRDFVAVRLSST